MAKTREQVIYRVGFHLVNPKNKYQLHEFISKKKAYSFWSDILDDSARYDGEISPNLSKIIGRFGYD